MPMIVQLHEGVALKKFPLKDKAILRIGRDPQSDIYIDDGVVSAEHAVIELKKSSDPQKPPQYTIYKMAAL